SKYFLPHTPPTSLPPSEVSLTQLNPFSLKPLHTESFLLPLNCPSSSSTEVVLKSFTDSGEPAYISAIASSLQADTRKPTFASGRLGSNPTRSHHTSSFRYSYLRFYNNTAVTNN
ncbi:hypothetical protein JMJ77_0001615, partial [Colletotrichum scovillei]